MELSNASLEILKRHGQLEVALRARALPPFAANYSPSRVEVYPDGSLEPALILVDGEQQTSQLPRDINEQPQLIEVLFDGEPAYMQTADGEAIYSRLMFMAHPWKPKGD